MDTTLYNSQTTSTIAPIRNFICEVTIVSRGHARLFSNVFPKIASSNQTWVLFADTLYQRHLFAYLLYDVTVSVGEVEILGPGLNLPSPPNNLLVRILNSERCPYMTAAFRGQLPFPDIIEFRNLHPNCIHSTAPYSKIRSTFIMTLAVNQRKMLCWILFGIAVSLICGILVGCITKKAEVALGVVMVLFEMINLAKGHI